MILLAASILEFSPLAALTTAGMLYLICLIVGGGLLLVSTFLGGDADVDVDGGADFDFDADPDIDFDGDVDLDADVAADAPGLSITDWFSTRFLVYFAAAFGLVGTVLTYTSAMGSTAILVSALVGGVIVGQLVHQVFRALRKTSGNTQTTRRDYVNRRARVTIAIEPPRRGEVALRVRGRERFVPSTSQRSDDRFVVGDSVAIVAFDNGTAEVVSLREYEFLAESKAGGNDEHDTDGTA